MGGLAGFTVGNDVFLRPGSRTPSVNRRLLAHEIAHVTQQRHTGVALKASPDPPPTAGPYPTVSQVLPPDGETFRPEYRDLQQRYERYKQGRTNPAKPERWVKLARHSNRAALMSVLGPNLGGRIEPANADEVDVLRLSELQRPLATLTSRCAGTSPRPAGADFPGRRSQRDLVGDLTGFRRTLHEARSPSMPVLRETLDWRSPHEWALGQAPLACCLIAIPPGRLIRCLK